MGTPSLLEGPSDSLHYRLQVYGNHDYGEVDPDCACSTRADACAQLNNNTADLSNLFMPALSYYVEVALRCNVQRTRLLYIGVVLICGMCWDKCCTACNVLHRGFPGEAGPAAFAYCRK